MRRTRLSPGAAVVALAIAAVVLASVAPPGSASGGNDGNEDQVEAVALPENAGLKYPNLGSGLDRLASGVEGGRMAAESAAAQSPVHVGGSVAVTIHLSGGADEVVSFLEEHGGDPRNVGEDYVEAYVPVALLGRLSEQPGVIRVREIAAPEPVQITQSVAGNGPGVHGSLAWNEAGWGGHGVKVGIIDGFRGLSSLMGSEVPAAVHGRCYTDIGVFTDNLADCETVDPVPVRIAPECFGYASDVAVRNAEHGTIVAESIFDIAPDASLYIANPRSRGDLQSAVDWMVSQGVQVINYSVGWTFDGPGDGTSPFGTSPLRAVDRAVASDVVWVNSAGNNARGTWSGGYSDPDGDGVLGFGGGNDEVIDMPLRACRTYRVQLRWHDNWYGASTDLDVYLYDKLTGSVTTISSTDVQSGQSGHVPHETFWFRALVDSNDFGIVVSHKSGGAPGWVQLTVWGGGSIERYTRNGSIGNPSESANPGMLAVGAAHWDDIQAIEPYSSRGPTPDGRIKPDVVGADCGVTALSALDEYNQGFCGTSQAAPHVAGLAALVRQRFPAYTPAEVAGYLKENAQQRQGPDPNNTWGHGFVLLPPPGGALPPAPAPPVAFTRNASADFNELRFAGNESPNGVWSDGETMWVSDLLDGKIYAYDVTTGARLPAGDFDTLSAAGNTRPDGIWSDGETMWVADWLGEKVYAYDMATKAWVPGKDFDTLRAAGNTWPAGIWSDGDTMWVTDRSNDKIYAYDVATRARLPGWDFDTLKGARNGSPSGIWSDGTTMWSADAYSEKVYAYDMATRERVPGKEFNTLITDANFVVAGIWSDGETMWVADWRSPKINAYHMPQTDRAALVALSEATGGAGWTNNANWLTIRHIGQWHGITVDNGGRVTALELAENGLSGAIPASLGSLANLERLELDGNALSGEIPQALTGLTALEEFSFHFNPGLCAPVDDAFQAWLEGIAAVRGSSCAPADSQEDRAVLMELHDDTDGGNWADSTNWLSGRPSREWYGVTADADGRVTGLYLGQNGLSGAIPASLGGLANLERLELDGNDLSGEIPAELGSLTNLDELRLSGNRLTGCVPEGLREALDDDFDQLGLPLCGPSITLTAASSTVRLGAPISVTATFSSQVSGFAVDDITVANGAAGNLSGGGAVYTFEVTPNAVGPVTVDVATGVAEDAESRVNTAAERLGLGLPYDDDGDGAIGRSEVLQAINDYFDGGTDAPTRPDVIRLINLYLSSPA